MNVFNVAANKPHDAIGNSDPFLYGQNTDESVQKRILERAFANKLKSAAFLNLSYIGRGLYMELAESDEVLLVVCIGGLDLFEYFRYRDVKRLRVLFRLRSARHDANGPG
jgi:hypothetical protein